jgi:hypothetical protein
MFSAIMVDEKGVYRKRSKGLRPKRQSFAKSKHKVHASAAEKTGSAPTNKEVFFQNIQKRFSFRFTLVMRLFAFNLSSFRRRNMFLGSL